MSTADVELTMDARYEALYRAAVNAAEQGPALDALRRLADHIVGRSGDQARPPHNAAVIQQYEHTVDALGWGTDTRNGLACLVCNCGRITGWLPLAEVEDIATEHRIEGV